MADQQQSPRKEDRQRHYRIIVSYRYRDIFDLSHRSSIENSIWHIVTALQYSDWYTGRWWVGCYIWYSEEGIGQGPSPPRPLLDRERNQARSKPDPVDRPVRTARTTVHHYTDTHYCWAHSQFCWHSPFCIPTSHLRCDLMEVRDHDNMGDLVPKTWVSWHQKTTWVSWYQKHGWAGTKKHFWILMTPGCLLALSNSLVSLYDHLPACSSHKDNTKTTQHPIKTFYAGRPSNLPWARTSAQHAGFHTGTYSVAST